MTFQEKYPAAQDRLAHSANYWQSFPMRTVSYRFLSFLSEGKRISPSGRTITTVEYNERWHMTNVTLWTSPVATPPYETKMHFSYNQGDNGTRPIDIQAQRVLTDGTNSWQNTDNPLVYDSRLAFDGNTLHLFSVIQDLVLARKVNTIGRVIEAPSAELPRLQTYSS